MTTKDYLLMRRAVEEARKSPESGARVGVVLARDGVLLMSAHKGEGGGTKHAEEIALDKAKAEDLDLAGATAYVTLEPCSNLESKNRLCCADRLADAGIAEVFIGRYDINPRINRLGWRALTARGVVCRDFPQDLRDELAALTATFEGFFLRRDGLHGTAKFDFTQNGGRYVLATGPEETAATWTTRWGKRGPGSIYANGGTPGVVALARYAQSFDQIDDPSSYDFENHFAELEVGMIAIYRNDHGHALVRLLDVEVPGSPGGPVHVSMKIDYELRPF